VHLFSDFLASSVAQENENRSPKMTQNNERCKKDDKLKVHTCSQHYLLYQYNPNKL
jgi:hypothetical protein